MADPNVMAAFGNKLASMVGQRSGYIERCVIVLECLNIGLFVGHHVIKEMWDI